MRPNNLPSFPQVKICGLTRPDEASACADLGADAIGLIFYSKSPRNLAADQARAVVDALPRTVAAVGVFVNATYAFIMERVTRCGLSMVQLHGQEPPELTDRLKRRGVRVIKALFVDGSPNFSEAHRYRADAFLVECARGPLPGGNAMAWNWAAARGLGQAAPLVLAGGLSPVNVCDAVRAALPAAVDVSSGVETSPGHKDLAKVAQLIEAVRQTAINYAAIPPRPAFIAGERIADERA